MKKFRTVLVVCLVLVMMLAAPLSASASTESDITVALRNIGTPEYFMGLANNVMKGLSIDSATADQIIGYINQVGAILNGRGVYDSSITYDESVQMLNLTAQAVALTGLQMTYEFAVPGPGANVTLADSTGKVILKFNTRDTGVVQTGYSAPYAFLAIVLIGAFGVAAVLVARKKYVLEK